MTRNKRKKPWDEQPSNNGSYLTMEEIEIKKQAKKDKKTSKKKVRREE
ncbi:MAG: DUF2382 domain-containing protein [Patescibacteria group bacterium]|nr:DUF2382 domain-containing protein [Patescibacteria group bacterium]